MSKNSRDNRPYIPPMKRLELSEKNIWLRVILIAVLLTIAVFAIGSGISDALKVEPGWNQIQATNNTINCSEDFKLIYDFTDYGSSASAAEKELTRLYTDATERAYRIFSAEYAQEGLHNMACLNDHINEEVTVDETLYKAFAQLEAAENRGVYLAPVYAAYYNVLSSEADVLAAENDPGKDPEAKAYVDLLMGYVSDPEMIRLELLGGNRVCLRVSEAYQTFAKEQELETFVDFGWMKNAFIADYIAERLSAEGFTSGYLVSFDGFTRNLDSRGGQFTLNLFDRQGSDIHMPGSMTYSGPRSIVFLRDYPLEEVDALHYYVYETGEITSEIVSPETGMSHAACDSLVSWSEDAGCAQILLQLIPHYLTEAFSEEAVNALRSEGIYSVWFEENAVLCNDPGQTIQILPDQSYTLSYTE